MCITINELTLIDKFVDINLGSTNLELYIFHITKKLGKKKKDVFFPKTCKFLSTSVGFHL